MEKIIKIICCYIVCLIIVSACWVGFEYILEGIVHDSNIDGMVAMLLSWFITDKYINR